MIDRVCARSGGIFIIPLLFLFLAILVMGQVVICDPQPWPNSFTRLRPIPKQRQLLMQEYQTLILRQANGNGTKVERATSRNCHALEESKPEDKIVLTPILVQGRLISRSTGFNSLYSVAFRVLKVLKGKLPRKLRRHVKLMYQQEDEDEKVNPLCEFPIKFDVKANRKYLIFIKRLGPARYVAIAKPEIWTKDVRRIAKKTLCEGCASRPQVSPLSKPSSSIDESDNVKLKCKVPIGQPIPEIQWLRNGQELSSTMRFKIRSKRRRSTLRISNVRHTDSGRYTCKAVNALGSHSQSVSISVRYSAPDPSVSNCPIRSFCLNGGSCFYYEFIGELVCKCRDGFVGQRCQFKKAQIDLPYVESEACGPYGHDIHFREICAAWKQPPITEMSRHEFTEWKSVERQIVDLRRAQEEFQYRRFRLQTPKLEAMALTQESHLAERGKHLA
ncbi:protein vein-like [Tigriopus californicus]|uniref:protein vein-like n=1 Tax=Tigriopus californicus TaxID=6832 RepID=UPI0027DA7368|nr:protein vein-like [Tigriopus californicus]